MTSRFDLLTCALLIALATSAVNAATLRAQHAPPSVAAEAGVAVGLGQGLGGGRVIMGGTPQRMIHFTFDDGPDPRTTPRLFKLLDQLGLKVTFFFSASRFKTPRKREAAMSLAKEALRRGHTVGSHSVEHVHMSRLNPAQTLEQVDLNDQLFNEVFGQRTYVFRPPFGSRNPTLDALLAERGYTTVIWNIGMADWVQRPPERILLTFRNVLKRNAEQDGQEGGVVLLHDTHAWSIDAFALIVKSLRERNCELLATGEDFYVITDSLAPFVVPMGDAAPGTHAPPVVMEAAQWAEQQARAKAAALEYCSPRAR